MTWRQRTAPPGRGERGGRAVLPFFIRAVLLQPFGPIREEGRPVVRGHGVFAGADPVAEAAVYQLVDFGELGRGAPLDAVELVRRLGRLQHRELPLRVGPLVL